MLDELSAEGEFIPQINSTIKVNNRLYFVKRISYDYDNKVIGIQVADLN